MPDSTSIDVCVQYGESLTAAGLRSTIAQAGLRLVDVHERPRVVVADYETALSLLATGRAAVDRSRLVVVSRRASSGAIRHALSAGATGYLTADCSLQELIAAIGAASRGNRFIGSSAAARLADAVDCEKLTARELDVLRLLAEGHANKAIARELDIALGTVKSHVKVILQKLDADSRTRAAAIADRQGLLDLEGLQGAVGRSSHHAPRVRAAAAHAFHAA